MAGLGAPCLHYAYIMRHRCEFSAPLGKLRIGSLSNTNALGAASTPAYEKGVAGAPARLVVVIRIPRVVIHVAEREMNIQLGLSPLFLRFLLLRPP